MASCFEACIRHRAEDAPGLGQSIDPFELLGRFNAVIKHSRRAETSCVSSHDVSGWSEFESREFKLAYFYYEAREYTEKEFWKDPKHWEVGEANSSLKRGGRGCVASLD